MNIHFAPVSRSTYGALFSVGLDIEVGRVEEGDTHNLPSCCSRCNISTGVLARERASKSKQEREREKEREREGNERELGAKMSDEEGRSLLACNMPYTTSVIQHRQDAQHNDTHTP